MTTLHNANFSAESGPAPKSVSFAEAAGFWLKLGLISFGGPAGQVALMHQELVERRRWISESRFLHALNYCMVLPGPEAQQLATYLGWLMHRTWGGLLAGGLFVLPSLLILVALSWVYMAYGHVTWVAGLFFGIKPAVAAIVLQAAHRVGLRALKNRMAWTIAGASFVAIFAFNVSFPLIVLLAAVVGYFGGKWVPQSFQTARGHGSRQAQKQLGPALIDDHTPTPVHALFTWARLIRVLLCGVGLWLLSVGVLVQIWGWDHTLTQMAWFFTKAALLTFGGSLCGLTVCGSGGRFALCLAGCHADDGWLGAG
jgi:chromate transporter